MRWGTRLHEDFLLPEGAAADIGEVVADLREHGIAFEADWLDAFTEFRFPRIGMTRLAGGVELELRQAIEPWNVLGEEVTEGGTARYVDSSVERIQVKVTGLDPRMHLVTCQAVPVPLSSTGRAGEFYAGVRYRAWQPWSALHPSIPVHAPLVFDVVDIESGVSLGGATYHVVHPGGRSYDHPPINSNEAEARRASRFEPHGHTAGRLDVRGAARGGAARVQPRLSAHAGPAEGSDRVTSGVSLPDESVTRLRGRDRAADAAPDRQRRRGSTRSSAPTARCGRRGRAWRRSPSN